MAISPRQRSQSHWIESPYRGVGVVGDVDARRGLDPAAGAGEDLAAQGQGDRPVLGPAVPFARDPLDPDLEDALARRDLVAGFEADPLNLVVVDEGPVGAAEVAKLAAGGVDLDDEMIARERRVFRHRAMDEPRTPHDEGIVAIEDERLAPPGPCTTSRITRIASEPVLRSCRRSIILELRRVSPIRPRLFRKFDRKWRIDTPRTRR